MKVPPPGVDPTRGREPHVGELFTDRETESEAFKSALAGFRRRLDRADEGGPARHNVLAYYGIGGIGKTALSTRLEHWVSRRLPLENGWGPPPATPVSVTARIDLHESVGRVNLLAVLLALRSGLAPLQRHWPAFDPAFTAYFSALRPGEPLPVFRGNSDLTDAITETVLDAVGEVTDVAALPGLPTAAGAAVRGVRYLAGAIRRGRDIRAVSEVYPGFEYFLLRCATEPGPADLRPDLALDLAGLLAWELSTMAPTPLAAVFVDATERLALDPRRTGEDLVSSLAFRMPNVLFVLTGRDHLRWYEEGRTQLQHRGPAVWPGLVPGADEEPRQHLVEGLSVADRRALVLRARDRDALPMSDEVVGQLVARSHGLPQYLELARQVALSIQAAGDGRQVAVSDVTGSLTELVERVLDDVPADEQRAIRAACLFQVFSIDLMAAAAGVDHGTAERAVQRPLVDRFPGERFPFRVHDAVREAIRDVHPHVAQGWSERDWEAASTRAASSARVMHDAAKAAGDYRAVMNAVGIAIRLVCDQETQLEPAPSDTYADWLSRAIVFAPSVYGLAAHAPVESNTEYGAHVLAFLNGKSPETAPEERLSLLRGVFSSQHPLHLPAGRHLGYTLKTARRWDEALAVFDELISICPSPVNLRQVPITLSMARRFIDARRTADGTDAQAFVTRTTEYAHGRPERYFSEVHQTIARYRTSGRQRELIEEEGDLLARRTLYRGGVTDIEIEAFQDTAEVSGHLYALRCALLASILSRRGDAPEALVRLRSLEEATYGTGHLGFGSALAIMCHPDLSSDSLLLDAVRGALATEARSRSWIPIEFFAIDAGLDFPEVETQWLEPKELVHERWRKHRADYLARTWA